MTSIQLSQIGQALSSVHGDCVLATLVTVSGSSYRQMGARMLILPNSEVLGGITAGCLEEDIRQCAFGWTSHGPVVKEFHIGTADDDLLGWGSGCKGTLSVLLQRVSPDDRLFKTLSQTSERRQTCVIATLIGAESNAKIGSRFLIVDGELLSDTDTDIQETLLAEARRLGSDFGVRIVKYTTANDWLTFLWETAAPPIQLLVFGASTGVAALLRLARELGWKTLLCNKSTELYNRQGGLIADQYIDALTDDLSGEFNRDPRTAAVVMTHHFSDDLYITEALLLSNIPYVGVLGGKNRNQRLRDAFSATLSPAQLEKLVAPIGLDIGAEEPCEFALSIASQVLAFMNRRGADHLLARAESIHAVPVCEQRAIKTSTKRKLAECREH